tara:strand:- start:3 stop:668 length:666 start_codon:yes stop_codon:yes gene_type:complete
MTKNYIIDFDSTFIQAEALEELADVALKKHKNKNAILSKIKTITNKGMEGKISFPVSLSTRIELLGANKKHIKKLIPKIGTKISCSFMQNKKFFERYYENIYIISGGFKEVIGPIVAPFQIKEKNIFANTFLFNKAGEIIGIDKNNLLAQEQGKVKQVKKLKLYGATYVLGDGYTDYEIKKEGAAHKFVAFTENVVRQSVVQKADFVAKNFDEFILYCSNN